MTNHQSDVLSLLQTGGPLRTVPASPPVVVKSPPPDPLTVALTPNQRLELGRLMRGPQAPITELRSQLQAILVEKKLAEIVDGMCHALPAGITRYRAGSGGV